MTDTTPSGTGRYEIRVRGRLDARWAAWFDGQTVLPQPDGTTVIEADALDQAALHGLLRRVRDTGLALVAVTPIDRAEHPAAADAPPATAAADPEPTR